MVQKYIFLDVDGTLFTSDGVLPESAVRAIKLAGEAGHKLFLCTGRSRGEIPMILWEQNFNGMIGSAGAYVEADGKVIYDNPLTTEQCGRLLEYLEQKKIRYICETVEGMMGAKLACEYFHLNMRRLKLKNKNLPADFFGNIQSGKSWNGVTPVYKVLYFSTRPAVKSIAKELGKDYTIIQNTLPIAGGIAGEISAPDMNKAGGIRHILDFYGASLKDTVAFGDGANDYEMLAYAHVGVAMGNAPESLKEKADMVTSAVDHDGLYQGFQMAGLIA